MDEIRELLKKEYDIEAADIEDLRTPTNDIYKIRVNNNEFALKLYQRKPHEVEWEIELLNHLIKDELPVVEPIEGKSGFVHRFSCDGKEKSAVVFKWLKGQKPKDSKGLYYKLGQLAAKIHKSADKFVSQHKRPPYNSEYLVSEQFNRIRSVTEELGLESDVERLNLYLTNFLASKELDFGICHMDLKPDNIHINNGLITVFDFDSAVESYRSIEPYRILNLSKDYFYEWVKGYREIREFNEKEISAVEIFRIIGDLRNAVWHLGYAESSRGEPTMSTDEFRDLVQKWIRIIDKLEIET